MCDITATINGCSEKESAATFRLPDKQLFLKQLYPAAPPLATAAPANEESKPCTPPTTTVGLAPAEPQPVAPLPHSSTGVKLTPQSAPRQECKTQHRRRHATGTKRLTPQQRRVNQAQRLLSEALAKEIKSSNKGYVMLQRMGYEQGKGLGKCGEGIVEPIGIRLKADRRGLGNNDTCIQSPAKESARRKTTKSTSDRAERDRQTHLELQHELRDLLADIEENERASFVASPVVSASRARDMPKHSYSPIRAPPAATPPAKHAPTAADLQIGTAAAIATAALRTSLEAQLNGGAEQRTLTPDQLWLIAFNFRDEIQTLHNDLTAAAQFDVQLDDARSTLVMAQIMFADGESITHATYEFIRTEIVNWISAYQRQQLATPIFHNMLNEQTHIAVLCEDVYAFECLEHCIVDISKMQILAPISLFRLLPHVAHMYCFSVTYADVVHNPAWFLKQIKLHTTRLRTERWLGISHEVRAALNVTNFILLVDEPSALTLSYHYKNRLFICMETALFTNYGRLPEV